MRSAAFSAIAQLARRVCVLPDGAGVAAGWKWIAVTEELFAAACDRVRHAEETTAASQALAAMAEFVARGAGTETLRGTLAKLITGSGSAAAGAGEESLDVPPSVRLVALIWVNKCFAFDDAEARFMNIYAAGDSRIDVRQAGIYGLSPKKFRGLQTVVIADEKYTQSEFPDFQAFVKLLESPICSSLSTGSWYVQQILEHPNLLPSEMFLFQDLFFCVCAGNSSAETQRCA